MGYGYYPFFDPTYILVIIGVLLSLGASARVKSTFHSYSRVRSRSGMTGAETAQRILHATGLYDVRVERVEGTLSDHYDPRTKVVRLSEAVYDSASIASIGVAAHECGHAIQHSKAYAPLKIRNALVPVVNVSATISWPMIIIGLIMGGSTFLIDLGIILFSTAVLFQLITLPVEYNASKRAVVQLASNGILYGDELKQTKKVLNAAALTYVAAAAATILQLLRLVILFGGRRRD
ncbi:MAG TPA: zinc metallopeptidase [Clostridiales bacterium]|nr:zinc metallopeptidase [Clostridiales bacterium]